MKHGIGYMPGGVEVRRKPLSDKEKEDAERYRAERRRCVCVCVCVFVCALEQSAESRKSQQRSALIALLRNMVVKGGFTTPKHIHGG